MARKETDADWAARTVAMLCANAEAMASEGRRLIVSKPIMIQLEKLHPSAMYDLVAAGGSIYIRF